MNTKYFLSSLLALAIGLVAGMGDPIPGTVVLNKITLGDDSITNKSIGDTVEMKGTPKQVTSIALRDAIPAARRTEGMTTWVTTNSTTYVLVGGIENANWQVFASGDSTNGLNAVTVKNNSGTATNLSVTNLTLNGTVSGNPTYVGSSTYDGVDLLLTNASRLFIDGAQITAAAYNPLIFTTNSDQVDLRNIANSASYTLFKDFNGTTLWGHVGGLFSIYDTNGDAQAVIRTNGFAFNFPVTLPDATATNHAVTLSQLTAATNGTGGGSDPLKLDALRGVGTSNILNQAVVTNSTLINPSLTGAPGFDPIFTLGNAFSITVEEAGLGALLFNRTDGPSVIFSYDNASEIFTIQENAQIQEGLVVQAGQDSEALTVEGGTTKLTNNTLHIYDLNTNQFVATSANGKDLVSTKNGVVLTNLANAPIIAEGANVTVTKTTNTLTGQVTNSVASSGGGSSGTNMAKAATVILDDVEEYFIYDGTTNGSIFVIDNTFSDTVMRLDNDTAKIDGYAFKFIKRNADPYIVSIVTTDTTYYLTNDGDHLTLNSVFATNGQHKWIETRYDGTGNFPQGLTVENEQIVFTPLYSTNSLVGTNLTLNPTNAQVERVFADGAVQVQIIGTGVGIAEIRATNGSSVISIPSSFIFQVNTNFLTTVSTNHQVTVPDGDVVWLSYSRPTDEDTNTTVITMAVSGNPSTITATNIYDVQNVKFWGAKGDSFTDDTSAFTNALANLIGEIKVPAGFYRIYSSLTVGDKQILKGETSANSEATTIALSGSTTKIILQSRGTLSGLCITGPIDGVGIEPESGANEWKIVNCRTYDNNIGMRFDNCYIGSVIDTFARNSIYAGVVFTNQNFNSIHFFGGQISINGYGVKFDNTNGAGQISFNNVTFQSNTNAAIVATNAWVSSLSFNNCYFEGTGPAMDLDWISGLVIEGSIFVGPGSGINIGPNCESVTLFSNPYDGQITNLSPSFIVGQSNVTVGGNLGVGTNVPIARLQVKGTTFLNGGVDIGDTAYFDTGVALGVQSARAFLLGIYDNAEAAKLILLQNGNLGVGEAAPGSKLSVSGGGSFGVGYDTTAAPTGGLIIEGNVGIGTIGPGAKLEVAGNISASTTITSTNGFASYATNIVVDAAAAGYTNTSGINMIANVKATSGSYVFYNRSGANGQTVCGTAICTNTIIVAGDWVPIPVNCGIQILSGVGVRIDVIAQ